MIFEAIEAVLAIEVNGDLVHKESFDRRLRVVLGKELCAQLLENHAVFGVQAGDEDVIGGG